MNDTLKTFNTTDTWLDVETLAGLKNISARAVRLALNKKTEYDFKTKTVRGGKSYKIRLSSIEEDLQVKYIKEYYDNLTFTNDIVELHTIEPNPEKVILAKQKNLALAKYDLIKL